jgi:hypothetical protein
MISVSSRKGDNGNSLGLCEEVARFETGIGQGTRCFLIADDVGANTHRVLLHLLT